MARITDNYIRNAVPENGKKLLSIRIETNLSVQIKRTAQNTITRSFVFRSVLIDGRSYTEYLGSVNDLTISDARRFAEERRELLKQGVVPKNYIKDTLKKKLVEEKKKQATLQNALDYFLAKRFTLSKNTRIHDKTMTNAIKPLLDLTLQELTFSTAPYDLIHNCIQQKHIAKAKAISVFLNQLAETAIDYNLIKENPFVRLKRIIPAHTVTHFASVRPDFIEEDLIKIFKLIFKKNKITLTNLYFLLGLMILLRPIEVAALKKSNWNRENQTLFVEKTKTLKNGWLVQTNDLLDKLLDYISKSNSSNKFFEGTPENVLGRLKDYFRRNKIAFTAHGWRSAGMSWLVQNGYSIHIANAILTHKIADDVTIAYMRSDLPNERREALKSWNIFLTNILKLHNPEIYRKIFQNI